MTDLTLRAEYCHGHRRTRSGRFRGRFVPDGNSTSVFISQHTREFTAAATPTQDPPSAPPIPTAKSHLYPLLCTVVCAVPPYALTPATLPIAIAENAGTVTPCLILNHAGAHPAHIANLVRNALNRVSVSRQVSMDPGHELHIYRRRESYSATGLETGSPEVTAPLDIPTDANPSRDLGTRLGRTLCG